LAQELDAYHTRSCHKEAAIELRRQHAEIERLKAERDEVVKAEREACAKLVEDKFDFCGDELTAAAAIRARGQEDKR
jgi:hypothetical protein